LQKLYSFSKAKKHTITYKQFAESFQSEKIPGSIAIKDIGQTGLSDKIMPDIILPSFYHDIAELEAIYFYQGSHYIDKPHYEKKE